MTLIAIGTDIVLPEATLTDCTGRIRLNLPLLAQYSLGEGAWAGVDSWRENGTGSARPEQGPKRAVNKLGNERNRR